MLLSTHQAFVSVQFVQVASKTLYDMTCVLILSRYPITARSSAQKC